ncbi:unnamed protein product [Citrullus colocynthis]|uniref:Uncharacterized protein n=1 Tax=Citrullus colocynthis TaxID=252529 RepID=A0ABP0Y384_9ROSI
MADFRYGFFCRPDNKKISESHPEEKNKTSHISDPKSNPARVDAGGRRQPTDVLAGTRYVPTTEKYAEEVYSSSRDNFQQNHTKTYEPVKNYGLHHDKANWYPSPAFNYHMELNKLIAEAQKETRQPRHEMRLSEPMNDIEKAMEYLKEAVNLHSSKNNACPPSDHQKKDGKEAARRYGKLGPLVSVPGANVATIDCKEAARRYKGATV